VVAVFFALWGLLLWFEWWNVFKPARRIEATPADHGLEFEDVSFVAEDGKLLNGWWVPHEQARGTILYCHGNAGNIGGRAGVCADLHRLGVNIFIFDYRGYGKSRGIPTERGTYRDVRAAYEYVRARHEDAEEPPVIVYGASLGGAVAAQVCLDKNVRGLVLENAFTSVPDMGRILYPLLPIRALGLVRYDTLAKIRRIVAAKLIAHSRDDDVVPYSMGEKLYQQAAGPKVFVALTGPHGEAGWEESPKLWVELERFVRSVLQ
jgi:hypothetical protein